MQHVQLPNTIINALDMEPKDLLIYMAIRRYMNNATRKAFPSLKTIAEKASASINTVRKSIAKLEESGFIELTKSTTDARQVIYYFPENKNFEPFSYSFLDNTDLSFTEKAYLAATQQFMFKNNNVGTTLFSNEELSKKINMPIKTIYKCDSALKDKGYLTILHSKGEGGLQSQEKVFNLAEFGQAVVFALQNHEERIENAEDSIDQLKKDLHKALSELKKLREDHDLLLKEKELKNQKID